MRAMFWNIRGFGVRGRRTMLKDYLRKHRIDIVCLQETIKQDFTDEELRSLEVGETFVWCWLPASGRSGGMLMGFRESMFEIEAIDTGRHFVSVDVILRTARLTLRIFGIYGPTYHALSASFLQELSIKVENTTMPIIMGGDFNLHIIEQDKNNDRINWPRLELFNNHIAEWGLREIPRTGVRFTWTNKQLNPVRCVLDRVFFSPTLEPHFPLCTLTAEMSLGSDHTPLIFDSGEGVPPKSNRFFFKSGWLEVEGFQELLQDCWDNLLSRVQGRDIVDWWKFMSTGLRQKLKGWNANKGRENREHKQLLVERIKNLDEKSRCGGHLGRGMGLPLPLGRATVSSFS
jgi:exonuclease III